MTAAETDHNGGALSDRIRERVAADGWLHTTPEGKALLAKHMTGEGVGARAAAHAAALEEAVELRRKDPTLVGYQRRYGVDDAHHVALQAAGWSQKNYVRTCGRHGHPNAGSRAGRNPQARSLVE